MNTVALEFVPPNLDDGPDKAAEEAGKILELCRKTGIEGRIQRLMIPGMIEEDLDRPVPMRPKMDPLDTWNAVKRELPGMKALCTQVTAFSSQEQLSRRFQDLLQAGIDGIIFVGVPRTMADGEGSGVAPTDALSLFSEQVRNRGVILIPTRDSEFGRFNFKCDQGATFGMTQLLFSDAIIPFLKDFSQKTEHRPELLISFGFVPKIEKRVKLINWLIQDPGNPLVQMEQAFIARLSEMTLSEKKRELVELYRRVVDGVRELGFSLSIHLEAPYGFTKPAFETFAEMLDYWAPDQPQAAP